MILQWEFVWNIIQVGGPGEHEILLVPTKSGKLLQLSSVYYHHLQKGPCVKFCCINLSKKGLLMKFHCREPIDDTCHCSSDKKLFAGKNHLSLFWCLCLQFSLFWCPLSTVMRNYLQGRAGTPIRHWGLARDVWIRCFVFYWTIIRTIMKQVNIIDRLFL